jgi:hypothetical protein
MPTYEGPSTTDLRQYNPVSGVYGDQNVYLNTPQLGAPPASNQIVPISPTGTTVPGYGISDATANAAVDPMTGMAPMTGFASRYTPAMADQVYENPWYLLSDIFPGMKTSSPGYQALRDLPFDPLTLYNLMVGSEQSTDQGAGDYINWLKNMYEQQGSVGGATLNSTKLLKTLFGQEGLGADSENSLGQILGAGDMGTQIRTLFNMAREVSNGTMNPLAARGYQSAIAQAGDRYGNAQMKTDLAENGGASLSPSQWIAQQMPWLTGR